ncbi:hypothetical protein [Fusibacter bizertensis]
MTNQNDTVTILKKFTIIPGHEETYLGIWQQEAALRQHYGFKMLNAFIETGSGMQFNLLTGDYLKTSEEKIFTALYSYEGDIDAAEIQLSHDEASIFIDTVTKMHIRDDVTVRQVNSKMMTSNTATKMVIMRRYQIVNDWNAFLEIWWRIVQVREKHGFTCLFAVEDIEERVFTWAFTYDGDDFETFMNEGQMAYYLDPMRVELEVVNDYLEEIRLTPARQIML